MATPYTGAVTDLGLGSTLQQQTQDETEEEKKRKKVLGLGLGSMSAATPAVMSLYGVGGAGAR